jgi:hypothetical protein
MADYTELLQAIKRAAVEAVAASQPLALCYGKVTSVEPLQIMADQKLPLEAEQLELTNAVQDCYIDVEISAYTENDSFMNGSHTHGITDTYTGGGDQRESSERSLRSESDSSDNGNLDTTHKHAIKGRKKLKLCNGLQVGEKVLLLRWQGGQKYLVLDRLEPAQTKGEW